MIFWEFAEDPRNNKTEDGHDDGHLCAFDTQKYHEVTVITNLCIDLLDIYGFSFMFDCSAREVTYSEYTDSDCKVPTSEDDDIFRVEEGCDDVFNISAFVQIAECEDAHYHPSDSDQKDEGHDNDEIMQVIFMTIVAVVVIVLALVIVTGVIRKKRASHVRSVNVSQEPLTVDFQSIQDADMEPISPDSTQQITTQGQEIEEIALDEAPGAMIIGDKK